MSNLKYSFVKQDTPEGNFVFRCEIDSFGLTNSTDKDIVSFYKKLSGMSYFDSGLLPVSGNGLLSLRYAGNHTQIVYQHAPSINHVNWGRYEGDYNAVAYYVAQPYRIVIADLLNDNFYGARIFYSPYPITHPDAQLYHVNLPNINCKGYRGNGVGWVCLYHTTDITSFPFNEKLAHVLERCSGIEAYNDQNMSETDGPRFYQSHYCNDVNFSHLWNPEDWQNFTESHGLDWVTNPDIWIPIKVSDIDNQGHHDHNGVPLTISMAMLGNYQAYYSDSLIPKPVNAIARFPEHFTNNNVENIFKIAFNSSSTTNNATNVYSHSSHIKNNLVNNPLIGNTSEEEDDQEEENSEDFFNCHGCDGFYNVNTSDYYPHPQDSIILYCAECFYENFVFLDKYEAYVSSNHPNLVFDNYTEAYFLVDDSQYPYEYLSCNCGEYFSTIPTNKYVHSLDHLPVYNKINSLTDPDSKSCTLCSTSKYKCHLCSAPIPDPSIYHLHQILDTNSEMSHVCNSCYHNLPYQYHKISLDGLTTADFDTYCICGSSNKFSSMIRNCYPNPNPTSPILLFDGDKYHLPFSLTLEQSQFFQFNKNLVSNHTEPFHKINIKTPYVCHSCYDQASSILNDNDLSFVDFRKYYKQFLIEKMQPILSYIDNGNPEIAQDIFANSMSIGLLV